MNLQHSSETERLKFRARRIAELCATINDVEPATFDELSIYGVERQTLVYTLFGAGIECDHRLLREHRDRSHEEYGIGKFLLAYLPDGFFLRRV